MMSGDLQVSLRIKGDGSGLTAVLKTAQGDVDAFAAKAQAAGNTASAGLQKAAQSAAQLGSTVSSGANAATAALTKVSGATSGVAREFAVMTGEALRGNFTRLIGSTTVLANRMGVLAAVISNPITLALGVATAAFGIFLYKSSQAEKNLGALQNALDVTSGSAGKSAEQLQELVSQISATGIKAKDAQAEVLALANSGKLMGETLSIAAQGAARFAELTGEKIGEAAKQFEALAGEPTKALVKLNDQTHLVDASTVALVAKIEESGNKFGAGTIAVLAFSNALAQIKIKNEELQKSFDADLIAANGDKDTAALIRVSGGLAVEEAAATKDLLAYQKLNAARNIISNAITSSIDEIIVSITKETEKNNELAATYGKGKVGLAEYTLEKSKAALQSVALAAAETTFVTELQNGVSAIKASYDSYAAYNSALDKANALLGKEGTALIASAHAADQAVAAHKKHKEAIDESGQALQDFTDYVLKLKDAIDDPFQKALDDMQRGLDENTKRAQEAAIAGADVVQVLKEWADADEIVIQRTINKTAAIKDSNDLLAEFNQKLAEDVRLSGLDATAKETERQYQEFLNKAIKDHIDLSPQESAAALQSIQNANVQIEANKRLIEVQKQFVGIAVSGFDSVGKSIADFATGSIKKWSDFGKSLIADTKQFIAQIIEEFLKLEVFNGIVNSLFGLTGTSSELATFSNLAGGSGGSGGGVGSLLNSGSSLASLGAKFFGGGSTLGGATASGSGVLSGTGFQGAGATFEAAPSGGFLGTGFSAAGVGGAVGGAFYGATLGSGGISTAASTATGAIAGYGVGVGVSAALAGGVSAGLAAVPVVGWIALAALIVDKISGGKLFGTKFQTKSTDSTLSLDASGGTLTATEYQERQGALFSGTKHRTKDIAVSADQQAAAQQIFTDETAAIKTQADLLGKTAGDLIAGTFDTITEYTKKGKVKSTKTISEFLGKQYTEDATAFQQRYAAENTIALIDQGDAAKTASGLADQYRNTASSLLDAAQTLFAIDVDLKNGNNILNDSSASLKQEFTAVQKYTQSGETLLQTYARLETETSNLNALYTDTNNKLTLTGDTFVKFSDDLAKAFGGVQGEAAALTQFYQEYYNTGAQALTQLTALQTNANNKLVAIGEQAGESTAQFAKDFAAALPNLTPDEIKSWVEAGNALYAATQAQAAYTAVLKKYTDYSESLAVSAGTETPYEAAIAAADKAMHDQTDQANQLAIAAGKAGASEADLANIHSIAAQAAAAALAQLEADTASLVNSLGLSTDGSGSNTSGLANSWNSVSSSASKAASAAKALYDAQIAAIKQVKDFLNSSLLNTSITTLTPEQRLAAAAAQYQSTLTGANAGNKDDLANLTQSAQAYLDAARTFYSSSDSYTAIFNAVRDGLSAFANNTPVNPGGGAGGSHSGSGRSSSSSATTTLSPLQQQLQLQTLIGNIHDLLTATGTPLKDLVTELHLDFPALIKKLGINLGDATVGTTEQLGTLAGQLGIPLTQLAQQLGFGLGDLKDKNSLDAKALQDKITKLPAGDSQALQPLFAKVTAATNAADANDAIKNLTDYVNTLPEAEKEQLAPYLAGVSLTGPLDYLTDINDSGKATADAVTAIAQAYTKPIRVYVVPAGTGTQVPGTGGAGTTPGDGGGSGGGNGGGAGPIGPGTHAVTRTLANNSVAQAASAQQTNVLISQLLAEFRALRTDTNNIAPKTLAGFDKVASKLDSVAAAGNSQAQAITRQADAIRNRR